MLPFPIKIWAVLTIASLPVAIFLAVKKKPSWYLPLLIWSQFLFLPATVSGAIKHITFLLPETWGYIEGHLDKDLTFPLVGRCRLDNPRATLKAGGDTLIIGYAAESPHVWGELPSGKKVDVTLSRDLAKRVIAVIKVVSTEGEKKLKISATNIANDKDRQVLAQGVPQITGILRAQGFLDAK